MKIILSCNNISYNLMIKDQMNNQVKANEIGALKMEGSQDYSMNRGYYCDLSQENKNFTQGKSKRWNFPSNKFMVITIVGVVLFVIMVLEWSYHSFFSELDQAIQSKNRVMQQKFQDIESILVHPKQESREQMMKECYRRDTLRPYVFFVKMDEEDLTNEQLAQFDKHNKVCYFELLDEKSLHYYIDLWNQREEQARFDQDFINKTELTSDQKRELLIWLKLYFTNSIYVHMKLGVNFGKYISDRYLLDIQVGKELTFGQLSHRNKMGIYVPERKFLTVKNGDALSEWARKIIRLIIAKQDYFSMFENHQSIIIKDAVQYPAGVQKNALPLNVINQKYPCPVKYSVSYIWLSGQLPEKYKQFIDRCKNTTKLITQVDLRKYEALWNQKFADYQINLKESDFVLQIDVLKKLHLYFEGGIYSDFDTVIDQSCWENIITDKIIFTNSWGRRDGHLIPEQNFIKVSQSFDHQLQKWIIQHVHEINGFSNRWDACRIEQCFIVFCQKHNYDNSWKKK